MKNDLEALKQDFEIAYGKVINGNQEKGVINACGKR